MGKFDIDYSQAVPSGRVGAVRANLDVSTGTEAVTGAIQRLGGELLDIDIAIQQRQQAVELSTFQRQEAEAREAALQALQSPDFDIEDEDAIVKLKEKADTDRTGINSKHGRVNFLYKQHLDDVGPAWDKRFFNTIRDIKAKNAKDDFDLNSEGFLAKGDLAGYQQLLENSLRTGVITKTEHKHRMENALIDSVFAQSRDLIADGNYLEALAQLEALEGLTPSQKEYRDKLSKIANKSMQENSDKAITSVVLKKDKLKDATALEKSIAAQEMKQELIDGGVAGDDLNKWFGILDKWSGGDKDPTEEYNPQRYAGLSAVCDLNPRSISEAQIYSFVGLGKESGITTGQAKSLVELRKRNIDEVGSLQSEIHKRYQAILKGMYNAKYFGTGADAALEYAETANKLTVWTNVNKDATPEQTEKFFAQLTAENEKEGWLKMIFTAYKGATVWGLPAHIKKAKSEYDKRFAAKEATQLAQGRPITREIGETEIVSGQSWVLVKIGETPDKDVWEKAE